MTANQVAWFRAVEEARANAAKEAEIKRSNLANEYEWRRHHTQQEGMGWYSAYEQERSNRARESISQYELQERVRSNRAREYFERDRLAEEARANRAREFNEASRNAMRRDELRIRNSWEWERLRQEAFRNLSASRSVEESIRANQERERQTRVRDAETHRANVLHERISIFNTLAKLVGGLTKFKFGL